MVAAAPPVAPPVASLLLLDISAGGDVRGVKLGDANRVSLRASALGTVQAARWGDGKIVAARVRAIKIKGNARLGTAGDFGADLDITGDAGAPGVLGTVSVKGSSEINTPAAWVLTW